MMSAATQAMAMMGGEATATPPAPKPMEREFAVAAVTVAGEDITGLDRHGHAWREGDRPARVRRGRQA